MIRDISQRATLAIALCANCVILATAAADEFSWQVSGSVQDGDAAGAVESNRFSLSATYYLSAVDDQTGPYELAPFLNRSGYLTVDAARAELRGELFPGIAGTPLVTRGTSPDGTIAWLTFPDVAPALRFFPVESGENSSEYAVAGRYVWPGSGWYAGAQAQRSDADLLSQLLLLQTAMDQESSGLFAGRYVSPRTTMELGLGSETVSHGLPANPIGIDPVLGFLGITGFGFFDFGFKTDIETENARLSVRHVGNLGGSTFSVSASFRTGWSDTKMLFPAWLAPEFAVPVGPFDHPVAVDYFTIADLHSPPIEISQSDVERQYTLSGALFPSQSFGLHLTYSSSDHDAYGSSDLIGLSTNWFFVRNAAVEIEMIRAGSGREYRPDSRDMDAFAVRLLGRF